MPSFSRGHNKTKYLPFPTARLTCTLPFPVKKKENENLLHACLASLYSRRPRHSRDSVSRSRTRHSLSHAMGLPPLACASCSLVDPIVSRAVVRSRPRALPHPDSHPLAAMLHPMLHYDAPQAGYGMLGFGAPPSFQYGGAFGVPALAPSFMATPPPPLPIE
jgi:hypothetical protein